MTEGKICRETEDELGRRGCGCGLVYVDVAVIVVVAVVVRTAFRPDLQTRSKGNATGRKLIQ